MVLRTGQDMMSELSHFVERFAAGEEEVARTFLTAPHEPADHAPALPPQCYRELPGPGLLKRHQSPTE